MHPNQHKDDLATVMYWADDDTEIINVEEMDDTPDNH
jgi:hypothetical protein